MITEVVTTDTVPRAGRLARPAGPLGRGAVRRGDLPDPPRSRRCSSLFDGVDPTHAPPQPRLPF